MKMVALGEVATIERRGVDPSTLPPHTAYLGLEHIERGGRIIGRSSVAEAELASTKFRFSADHVLFGKLRPNLGKISRPGFDGVCSTDILPIRPGRDLDRGYLAHYLSQPSMVDFAASRTSGANLPRLSPTVLAQFPIPLPPLSEQRRIAAILDHADALRAKRRRVVADLDALTQSIFHDMFGDELWAATLGELADVQIGPFGSLLHQSDYVSGGVVVINPMHIRGGTLQPDPEFSVTERKALTLELYRLLPGDVVLGRRGEMARAGIATAEHAGMLCGTGSIILRPRGVDSRFLHAVVTSPRMKQHLERSSLGATLPNLNAAIVNSSPSPRAPAGTQSKFSAAASRIERAHADVAAACSADDELFASLQARAFDGRL